MVSSHAERLRDIGRWLQAHGPAICGSRKGALPASPRHVSTQRGGCHQLFLLDHISDVVTVANVPDGISHATLMATGTPLDMAVANTQARITIPGSLWDPSCKVVTLA